MSSSPGRSPRRRRAALPRVRAREAFTGQRLVVVGRGRLGRSLAAALEAELVPGRGGPREFPGALVLLAVSDPAIAGVAREVTGADAVVHVAGSLGLDVLEPHPRRGSFHPYQSFPIERGPEAFAGSLVAIDASDRDLLEDLERMARSLGATTRRVTDADRILYHASAALASNMVVALAHRGEEVLRALGWSRDEALTAIVPLMTGVVANLGRVGLPDALIGPIRRGDAGTVRRHLTAFEQRGLTEQARIYRILGLAALELAIEAGLDAGAAAELNAALTA